MLCQYSRVQSTPQRWQNILETGAFETSSVAETPFVVGVSPLVLASVLLTCLLLALAS